MESMDFRKPTSGRGQLLLLMLLNALIMALISVVLIGCGVPGASVPVSVPALPAVTGVPVSPTASAAVPTGTGTTGTPDLRTRIIATRVAYATEVANSRRALRTSVALTHAPTITPGLPPILPSPTPMMGMLPGCSNKDTDGPQAISCSGVA